MTTCVHNKGNEPCIYCEVINKRYAQPAVVKDDRVFLPSGLVLHVDHYAPSIHHASDPNVTQTGMMVDDKGAYETWCHVDNTQGMAKGVVDPHEIKVLPEDRRAFADMMIARWEAWAAKPTFRPWEDT